MKRTLVVHSAKARKDIEIWLKRKGVDQEWKPKMAVELENESVVIIEKSRLTDKLFCHKLVLYGEFTEINLSNIMKFVCFI